MVEFHFDARASQGNSACTSDAGFSLVAIVAWRAVRVPLAWGIWVTLQKALKLLQ